MFSYSTEHFLTFSNVYYELVEAEIFYLMELPSFQKNEICLTWFDRSGSNFQEFR